jgi:MinD-like ATPase involved in chromosome partitioning or flagellar assembly
MSEATTIFFDDSLRTLVKELSTQFNQEELKQGLVVRDTSGRLRFLSAEKSPSDEKRPMIEGELAAALGAYARENRVIAFSDEPGVQLLLKDPTAFNIQQESFNIRYLDRRIVGSAWVDSPRKEAAWPPRIVFASLKGGVGRSTALAVTAADLARRNKNILVIDLDLEAPGLGDMLLDKERTPRFGAVDYLVEKGLGGISDSTLSDFVGTSNLTTTGGGRVDVVPAIGSLADKYPENVLPKISRAMIEDIDSNGDAVSVTNKIADMVERLTNRDTYDVVLIDSRAGLSELAAPTILGLGANVLLFGTAQRQTIQGYAALFAALKLLAQRDLDANRSAEWRLLFKAVHAKASSLNESTSARYRDDLYELFADNLYDTDDVQQDSSEALSFSIDDKNGPHWPLTIPFAQNLIDFDPVQTPSQLLAEFYEQFYRPFLNGIDSIVASSSVDLGDAE